MRINPETGCVQEGLRWRIADKIHEKFDGTRWIRVWWWLGYHGLYPIDWWLQGYPAESVNSRPLTRIIYFVLNNWSFFVGGIIGLLIDHYVLHTI